MPPPDHADESLHCPLPFPEEERITLGHGSGGILTAQLLENGVFRLLDNPLLARRHDGAILPPSAAELAFTTDSFVVSPLFFPGGDIGSLAVHGTVNDLAMCGAIPEYLSLAFILEEGLPIRTFYKVLESIRTAAHRAGVQLVTGDTKVVERGKGDQLFVNTSGVGRLHPRAAIHAGRVRPGDAVLLSGPVASHGMAILSVRDGLAFESDILSDSASLAATVRALLDRYGNDVHFLRDPTRGGLATALSASTRCSSPTKGCSWPSSRPV
jgi:hydrogenase expression/formation protein HypE